MTEVVRSTGARARRAARRRHPGHTLGHRSLHLPDRDAVIAGDAVVTLDPYTGRRGPRLVARAATADVARNLTALDALAATRARTVLVDHGDPVTSGVEAAVQEARRTGAAEGRPAGPAAHGRLTGRGAPA